VEGPSVRSGGGLSIVSMAGLRCVFMFPVDINSVKAEPLADMTYGVAIFNYIKHLWMLHSFQVYILLPSVTQNIYQLVLKKEKSFMNFPYNQVNATLRCGNTASDVTKFWYTKLLHPF
jgi:hypothetical protein